MVGKPAAASIASNLLPFRSTCQVVGLLVAGLRCVFLVVMVVLSKQNKRKGKGKESDFSIQRDGRHRCRAARTPSIQKSARSIKTR